jgi:hypothetical protein
MLNHARRWRVRERISSLIPEINFFHSNPRDAAENFVMLQVDDDVEQQFEWQTVQIIAFERISCCFM